MLALPGPQGVGFVWKALRNILYNLLALRPFPQVKEWTLISSLFFRVEMRLVLVYSYISSLLQSSWLHSIRGSIVDSVLQALLPPIVWKG
jgi:hypothetical protein